jgi:hypothetical protein
MGLGEYIKMGFGFTIGSVLARAIMTGIGLLFLVPGLALISTEYKNRADGKPSSSARLYTGFGLAAIGAVLVGWFGLNLLLGMIFAEGE